MNGKNKDLKLFNALISLNKYNVSNLFTKHQLFAIINVL